MKPRQLSIVFAVACALATSASAAVKLPQVISNNMVVQSGEPLAIWGWADAGEKVTIKQGGVVLASAEGLGNGRNDKPWRAQLPAQKPGPVADIEIAGTTSVTLTNVLAGDVWLCSGQSNMVMAMSKKVGYGGVLNEDQELAAASDPQLRFFQGGNWEICTPENAPHFSAVGYFFARKLRAEMKMPVGIMSLAAGGMAAELFTPARMIDGDPDLLAQKSKAKEVHDAIGPRGDAYGKAYKEMKVKAAAAKLKGEKGPPPPVNQLTPAESKAFDDASLMLNSGSMYERVLRSVIPYNIKGFVWYQGEANGARGDKYAHLMSKLIQGWREDWGKPAAPFIMIALAGFGQPVVCDAKLSSFPLVREAMIKVAATVPNTGVISAVDVGEPTNIHPHNKQPVGDRAALWALNHVYGQQVVAEGPGFGKVTFAAGKALVPLTTNKDGVVLKGPGGFELAGADQKFIPAKAELKGASLEVTAPEVPTPVALRYAFLNFPECTVYNGAGIPAMPFRTDDWPVQPVAPVKR